MNQPQTIIVYRSRGEQLQDEFIQEHPEAILWFLGFIIVAFVVYGLQDRIKNIFKK